jgi:hypothetical protein
MPSLPIFKPAMLEIIHHQDTQRPIFRRVSLGRREDPSALLSKINVTFDPP